MAGSYLPTVTTSVTPFISVSTDSATTYDELQATQGSIMYKVLSLYMKAQNLEQLNLPMQFEHYDSKGSMHNFSEISVADPLQFQFAKNTDFSKSDIIFDGRLKIDLTLLPLASIQLIFSTEKLQCSHLLESGDFFKILPFFKDYNNEIS